MEAIKIVKQDGNRAVGIWADRGEFLAMTFSKSKTFKTLKGAERFLEKNGYPLVDQELIEKCRQAGKQDHAKGKPAIPHSSERLNALTSNFKVVGESIPYLKAWTSGWLSEQLAESV